jgi:hypothetical protein
MRPAVVSGSLTVVVVLLLSGCSTTEPRPRPAASTSSSRTSHVVLELHEDHPSPGSAEERDPVAAARTFLIAWSRPDLSYPQWWSTVEPLLNAQGQQAYAGTDPAVVPRLHVSGELELVSSSVDTSALVWIPTDQGRFGLQLSRLSGVSAWKVSRIYFPGTGPEAKP